MDNLTALVSAFARAYHYKNNRRHISADPLADKMLTDEEYTAISQSMSQGISCAGSTICFDYPQSSDGTESKRNRELAAAAGEQMKAQYSYDELEELLSEAGFLVYEHLDAEEATNAFFQDYNNSNREHSMTAPAGVGYCLAVKQAE